MVLRQTLRDLVLATWDIDATRVAAALPRGLEPQLAGGRALVSVLGSRVTGSRLAGLPLPAWSHLAVRTYVNAPDRGEHGIYVWLARASFPGGAGAAFGMPLRTTFVRVAPGSLEARGVGIALRYRVEPGPPELPETTPGLGEHDVAFYARWGNTKRVGRLVARHAPIHWQNALVVEEPRLDPVLALGFDLGRPRWCAFAEATEFATTMPPKPVRL